MDARKDGCLFNVFVYVYFSLACGRMFRTKLDMQLRLQGKLGGTFHNLRESISIILQESLKQPEV